MSNQEKWAWWTLATVFATIAAYVIFLKLVSSGPASMSVFALLALTAVPSASRRRWKKNAAFDERERLIAEKSLLAGFGSLWIVLVAAYLVLGFANHWEGRLTIPFWALTGFLMGALMVVIGVEALTTLILCRRVLHA
jgi:hypothetical protein